ncbi:TIGR03016 family PEP-CTERM system-associated outer membrane protein [Thalassotalea sp. PLHSN55]|uniref:TIGR03016 family PEP-CTERM system-associated outer membrane protein n=1 Tax=Thalassotalea sp. PLHSN55 TaxID=3435888 RepID=UPI003F83838A
MATMVMATTQKTNKVTLAVILAMLPAYSMASSWNFTPQLTLDETFSDNVELSRSNETSSLVSQVGVKLQEEYVASKAGLNIDLHSVYAMYSHDSDINNDYHTLDSNGYIHLGPDGLSLIGRANIAQESRSAGSNALADIVSGDIVEIQRYTTGLNYETSNSEFSLSGSVLFAKTLAEDNIGESDGIISSLRSANGSNADYVFWELSAEHNEFKNRGEEREMYQGEIKLGLITGYKFTPFVRYYDENFEGNFGSQALESNSYGLGVRWLVNPRLQVDVSYNKPIDEQVDSNGEVFEEYVDSKIQWQPTERTSLTASFSQRFFGDSYGLDFKHRNRRLTNKITYTEQVEAFTRYNIEIVELGQLWCPTAGFDNISECNLSNNPPANIDDYELLTLNNNQLVEDNALTLNKRLSWTTSLTLPRTKFSLTVSGNDREDLENGRNDKYLSARFNINREVSGYSTVNFSTIYTENELNRRGEGGRQDDEYRRYLIEYDRKFNSRLSAVFGLSHLTRESTNIRFNYDESRVYLQLTKGF